MRRQHGCGQIIRSGCDALLTLLVEDDNISTSQIDGVSGAESGHCATSSVWKMACDAAHDRLPGESSVGGGLYLQPPPTTITLGAIVMMSRVVLSRVGVE